MVRFEASGTAMRFIILDRDTMNRTWRVETAADQSLRYAIGFDDVDVTASGQVKGMISDPERTMMLLGDWQDGEQTRTGREFLVKE